jgi:hypothetical protein
MVAVNQMALVEYHLALDCLMVAVNLKAVDYHLVA